MPLGAWLKTQPQPQTQPWARRPSLHSCVVNVVIGKPTAMQVRCKGIHAHQTGSGVARTLAQAVMTSVGVSVKVKLGHGLHGHTGSHNCREGSSLGGSTRIMVLAHDTHVTTQVLREDSDAWYPRGAVEYALADADHSLVTEARRYPCACNAPPTPGIMLCMPFPGTPECKIPLTSVSQPLLLCAGFPLLLPPQHAGWLLGSRPCGN